ncbi:MAG: RNA-binding domain-containing protein [Rhodoglobus sp.]
MDDLGLRKLIALGETMSVEFKTDTPKTYNDSSIIETVVCLANSPHGGDLLIGVEDDGQVTGARPRHGKSTDPIKLQAMVANNTVPQVVPSVEVISIDDMAVIRVEVAPAPSVVGTRDGKYVRRGLGSDGKPACLPFLAHEMLADRIARGEADYATIAEVSATLADLEPAEFDRFRERASVGSTVESVYATMGDVEILSALGVAELRGEDVLLRRGALLLFGSVEALRRYVPTHETIFQVLERGVLRRNIIGHEPLFKSADVLFDLLREQNLEDEVVIGLTRVGIDRVPEIVARELVANALVHRDYTVMGAVRVQVQDDELTITSPGGFPRGVTVENFLESSNPRSRVLADAFKEARFVDRAGRGINRVFETALRSGRPEPDYTRSTADQVAVTVALGGSDTDLVRFVIEHDQRSKQRFELPDLQIVRALKDNPRMTLSEIAEILQQPQQRTRSRLTTLLEDGLVEMRGDGRARRYTLSAATYRSLSSAANYVRIRPFDEPQQIQMILNYIDANGSISRSEAAELCGTSPEAARRLLFRLRDERVLRIVGERRGARYFLV